MLPLPRPPRAVITARWRFTCRHCRCPAEVGERIEKYGAGLDDGWQHYHCDLRST